MEGRARAHDPPMCRATTRGVAVCCRRRPAIKVMRMAPASTERPCYLGLLRGRGRTYMCVCAHVRVCARTCVCVCLRVYVYMRARACVCACVCAEGAVVWCIKEFF